VAWRLTGDGQEIPAPDGADAVVWRWELVSDVGAEHRPVLVRISRMAMVAESVHFRVRHARESKGQTEVQRILDWEEPPEQISFHSASTEPEYAGGKPGGEVLELAQITAWFDERGIALVFTGREGRSPTGVVNYGRWAANLIDPKADELVHRVEAPSRIEAAREAKRWWEQERPARPADLGQLTASAQSDATLELSTGPIEHPKLTPEQRQVVKQYRVQLIYSLPDEGNPESGYVIEAYDDAGGLIDIGVAETVDDALLAIIESITPPEDKAEG
jgi:hypothetical protein